MSNIGTICLTANVILAVGALTLIVCAIKKRNRM